MIRTTTHPTAVLTARASIEDFRMELGAVVAAVAALALAAAPMPGLVPALDGWSLLGLTVYGMMLWSVAWRLLRRGRSRRA